MNACGLWWGWWIQKKPTCIAMPTAKYLLFVFGPDAGHINKCQLLAGHQLRMQSQSRVETRSKLSANTKIRGGIGGWVVENRWKIHKTKHLPIER